MKQFFVANLLLLVSVAVAYGQYYPFDYPGQYYLPYPQSYHGGYGGHPYASIPDDGAGGKQYQQRFFTTFTLTLTSTTSTKTVTTTTTCTTSAATLTTCKAGRRRRGVPDARGLFYDEDEKMFPDHRGDEDNQIQEVVSTPLREVRQAPLTAFPFVVQPGFRVSDDHGVGRLWLAFGTSTITATATSTYTSSLTAVCSSTTSFSTCSSGK